MSQKLAERSVVKGIGIMAEIKPVTVKMALQILNTPQLFIYSRTWMVPRIILKLASGQLALGNVSLLVAEEEFSSDDLLIDIHVLRNLIEDSRTL